ncbi:glutaminyl-peptide cyclotransferase [Aurantibacter crassamenti]|uniref:glutaminyl-peptide cyclotransferase n=1 Tax=Aurantibacter crassamenti TaxID=1837375 RepID=UPI0019394593|nr:glutaminyl-peptide cyclotransferase [Aurantibacter crassamenti]MBM1107448.1 glutaminyl-peptide cyclotransferase [Aurantibacter crassamenti]
MVKVFVSLFISLIFMACGDRGSKSDLFQIDLEGGKNIFQHNQSIGISINNKNEKSISKVVYSIDGTVLPVNGNKINMNVPFLGNRTLSAAITYEDGTIEISKDIRVLAENAPEVYTYEIVNTYPHDTGAYTQGLEFHNDTLYEGTGKKGRSFLRKFDYKTGKVINQIDLDKSFFGEGITIMKDKIYQLTWRGKTGFVYDLNKFEKIDSFQYGESTEGWGLCNDGEKIFKSDGTEKIWFLNPDTLVEEGHIEIVTNKSVFNKANELEYVDGKIYANVYQRPSVMIIDASSGAIEGVINFGGLDKHVTKGENWNPTDNVLNGIAYHPTRKTFFVTGKDWDKLFEVTIAKK